MKAKQKAVARRWRILIVDDHPIVRRGLVEVINAEPDLEVCGEADDAGQALGMVSGCEVDLLLTDYSLTGKNGVELIKDVRAIRPDLAVLVLSMHDETIYAERALRAGARGYIMKQRGTDNLISAIRRVMAGEVYLSAQMSRSVLEQFSSGTTGSSPIGQLTDREFEVFELIGAGLNSQEMAGRLRISSKTVDAHRANIKEKLKLKSGTELVLRAVRWVESQR